FLEALSESEVCRRLTDSFVRVRKSDLDKLTTEVMQLREFLPRVLNRDLMEISKLSSLKEKLTSEKSLQYSTLLLSLDTILNFVISQSLSCVNPLHVCVCVCVKEKLLLREQLWQSGAELQQQADFCSSLGSASCSLLWSCSSSEQTVTHWLGKLQSFLLVAAQTLESFVRSLDEEVKAEDHNSQEHQFVLAVAGTITNIAAVPCGRDFLSSSAHVLLDTLMKLLELMKSGVFPKLKVLMLMALYNVSISIKGLKYISENPGLLPLIWTLLDDGDWEVCLHSLRLLQSVLLEEEVLLLLGSSLLDPELQARVSGLTSSKQPSLRVTAQQTLEDLQALTQHNQA
uniref:Heat shock transcription factor 2 binding protein n=1 Tax=Labrus bergylta TaxID=56723 RepID=A0A3Q3M0H0_9LABR